MSPEESSPSPRVSTYESELEAERQYAMLVDTVVGGMREHLECGGITENVGHLDPRVRRTLVATRTRRLEDLELQSEPFFGRVSRRDQTGSLYVGRSMVRNPGLGVEPDLEDPSLLVISWQAPAAASFYRARPGRGAGLSRKRAYRWLNKQLDSFEEEAYSEEEPQSSVAIGAASMQDTLLMALERERDPFMRDIASTIQADQYAILEQPPVGVMVVQGAPGTGKTAVALHRLSWLAYNYPQLQRNGLLLVGPSDGFLRYVSQVLPSLGDENIRHATVSSLVDGATETTRTREARAAKGHGSWAEILRTEVMRHLRPLRANRQLRLGRTPLQCTVEDSAHIVRRARSAKTYARATDEIRADAAKLLAARYTEAVGGRTRIGLADFPDPEGALLDSSMLRELVRAIAPPLTSRQVLADLYSQRDRVARDLSTGLAPRLVHSFLENADPTQMDADDLILVDELDYLLGKEFARFGHIAIDEAQDLTDMEVRAIARRCGSGGVTLVGDLAQASFVERRSWSELTSLLTVREPTEAVLLLSYRVPRDVMDYANTLLRHIDAEVPAGVAVRAKEQGLRTHAARAQDAIWSSVRAVVQERSGDGGRLAVIAHSSLMRNSSVASDLQHNDMANVYDEVNCKGLEFDNVILVEPAAFANDELGRRSLYVAVTRCTQRLDIVHWSPVPFLEGSSPDPEWDTDVPNLELVRARLASALERLEGRLEAASPPEGVQDTLETGYSLLNALEDADEFDDSQRDALIRSARAVIEQVATTL